MSNIMIMYKVAQLGIGSMLRQSWKGLTSDIKALAAGEGKAGELLKNIAKNPITVGVGGAGVIGGTGYMLGKRSERNKPFFDRMF